MSVRLGWKHRKQVFLTTKADQRFCLCLDTFYCRSSLSLRHGWGKTSQTHVQYGTLMSSLRSISPATSFIFIYDQTSNVTQQF